MPFLQQCGMRPRAEPLSGLRNVRAVPRYVRNQRAVRHRSCVVAGAGVRTIDLMMTTVRGREEGNTFRYTTVDTVLSEGDRPRFLADVKELKGYYEGTLITLADFKSRLLASGADILFFIHGFNVQSEGTFISVKKMQDEFDRQLADPANKDKDPVLVVPIDWPCSDEIGALRDYYADQTAATAAANAIGSLFDDVMFCNKLKDKKTVNIVAHSMGCRLLRFIGSSMAPGQGWNPSVLSNPNLQLKDAVPTGFKGVENMLSNVFWVASDVPNIVMETPDRVDEKGKAISSGVAGLAVMTKSMTVMHAWPDYALLGSRLLNWSQRLGDGGPTEVWNKLDTGIDSRVEVVDCSEWNNKAETVGHGYFAAPEAVKLFLDRM